MSHKYSDRLKTFSTAIRNVAIQRGAERNSARATIHATRLVTSGRHHGLVNSSRVVSEPATRNFRSQKTAVVLKWTNERIVHWIAKPPRWTRIQNAARGVICNEIRISLHLPVGLAPWEKSTIHALLKCEFRMSREAHRAANDKSPRPVCWNKL